MTKKEHIKKFGHIKFYNMISKYPKGITNIGDLYEYSLLSNEPKEAKKAFKLGFYTKSSYKPCPFCTGEADWFVAGYDLAGVGCIDCGVKIIGEDLKKRWNKRINNGT